MKRLSHPRGWGVGFCLRAGPTSAWSKWSGREMQRPSRCSMTATTFASSASAATCWAPSPTARTPRSTPSSRLHRHITSTSGRSTSSRGSSRSPATAACPSSARAASTPHRRPRHPARDRGACRQRPAPQDLRELLGDLQQLPDDQRAALLLSSLGDLSGDEIAEVVGCRPQKVKALVFQARTSLMNEREARNTDCDVVREQLATLRGGALLRGPLRRHVRTCEAAARSATPRGSSARPWRSCCRSSRPRASRQHDERRGRRLRRAAERRPRPPAAD